MAKVVKLNSLSDQYLKHVISAVRQLAGFERKLFSTMLNLALSGSWKDSSDNVPEGEIVEFTSEMFKDIEDVRIQQLKGLYDKIIIAKAELEKIKGTPMK